MTTSLPLTESYADALVTLYVSDDERGGRALRPHGTERWQNDEAFRRRAMRARSALAVLLLADHFKVRRITLGNATPALLLCNADRAVLSEADARVFVDPAHLPEHTKAVVPTIELTSWQRQPAWMVVLDPQPDDYKLVYLYLRASVLWLEDRQTASAEAFDGLGLRPSPHGSGLEKQIREAVAS